MEEVLASDAVNPSPVPAAVEMPAALRLRTVAVRAGRLWRRRPQAAEGSSQRSAERLQRAARSAVILKRFPKNLSPFSLGQVRWCWRDVTNSRFCRHELWR